MKSLLASTQSLDERWSRDYHLPLLLMIDNAGRAVAHIVMEKQPDRHPPILILAGAGNNGADGWATARHLKAEAYQQVQVLQVGDLRSGEAQAHARMAQAYGAELLTTEDDWRKPLSRAAIVVDALMGRGLNRPLCGLLAEVIEAAPTRPQAGKARLTLAIDVPSGIHAATGQVMGVALQADMTVPLTYPAPGLYLHPGKAHAGQLVNPSIGCPPDLLSNFAPDALLLEQSDVALALPVRTEAGHKYQAGQVLVVASSLQYPGAGQLVCRAAFAAGAGMVRWALPPELLHPWPVEEAVPVVLGPAGAGRGRVCDSSSPAGFGPGGDAIASPLGVAPAGPHEESAGQTLKAILSAGKIQALAYGPGLATTEDAIELSRDLLPWLTTQYNITVVLDADGLNHVAALGLNELSPNVIITPHRGELQRLAPDLAERDPLSAVRLLSKRLNCHVLLKSPNLLYAGPEDPVPVISPFGNNGMATAGTGDVLTGILAGLAAQMSEQASTRRQVCLAGMGLHGLAGDAAAQGLTPYCLTAGKMIGFLPHAFKACGVSPDARQAAARASV